MKIFGRLCRYQACCLFEKQMTIKPKRPLLIQGQWGLGDNIYARPFVKKLCEHREVYLDTPWPEIYEDLPVKFILKPRRLRTQMKNVDRQPETRWAPLPCSSIEK